MANPITRRELFMAAIAGENVSVPTPVTREEIFLKAILDAVQSGGGGSGGGVTVIGFNENGTLDITAGELINAALAGLVIAVYQDESSVEVYNLLAAVLGGGQYTFDFGNSLGLFYASSADDYPSMESSGGGGD